MMMNNMMMGQRQGMNPMMNPMNPVMNPMNPMMTPGFGGMNRNPF